MFALSVAERFGVAVALAPGMDDLPRHSATSTPRDELVGALADDLAAEAFMFGRSLRRCSRGQSRAAPARRDELHARAQRIEALARGVLELDRKVSHQRGRELWRRVEVMLAQLQALDDGDAIDASPANGAAFSSGSWSMG